MKQREESESPEFPEDLIPKFSRCANYPRTPLELRYLTMGLARAAGKTGIPMEEIIEECLVSSEYCPTDHDLLTVATYLKQQRDRSKKSTVNQEAEWRKQYGPSKKFDLAKEAAAFARPACGRWFENRQLLDKLAAHFGAEWGKREISWRELFEAKKALGFALTPSEASLAGLDPQNASTGL